MTFLVLYAIILHIIRRGGRARSFSQPEGETMILCGTHNTIILSNDSSEVEYLCEILEGIRGIEEVNDQISDMGDEIGMAIGRLDGLFKAWLLAIQSEQLTVEISNDSPLCLEARVYSAPEVFEMILEEQRQIEWLEEEILKATQAKDWAKRVQNGELRRLS